MFKVSSSRAAILTVVWFFIHASNPSAPGYLMAQAVDATEKSKAQLGNLVSTLSGLAEGASRLDPSTFNSEQERQDAITSIREIIRSLVFLQRQVQTGALAFREEVLTQLNGTAAVMVTILQSLDGTHPQLSKVDQHTVTLVAKDLKLKMSNVNELRGLPAPEQIARYPQFPVTVKTIAIGGREESRLTIYYVPQALYGTSQERINTRSFRQLSSPSKQELPEADYYLWATRGVERTPVTPIKDLSVRKPSASSDNLVELLVQR
jgi:hypothetical protein